MVTFDDEGQEKKVEELRRKEEEELARILSEKYKVPYADLSRTSINTDALRLIPEEEARRAHVALYSRIGKKLTAGVLSPIDPLTKTLLASLGERGFSLSETMVSNRSLERAWERYKDLSFATETKAGVFDISNEEVVALTERVSALADIEALIREVVSLKKAYRISRILEIVLAGALSLNASDVHMEPQEEAVRLRLRLDGVLTDVGNLDKETYGLLLSRIKLLSGLKLNVVDEAQDGRFSIKISEDEIEIRTSILPGPYKESVVLRVLNPNTIAVPMEELGIEKKLLQILEKELRRPNGMILTTGPTGSGKTTTLYAFLRKIHTPDIKIITIEDPIEYHLQGIVQTQVDKKNYTFSLGLRSALRQDPDVIMVGEIRDSEVAETAINAALTGHLVFSTLHTNNAAGTFPRLIDLEVNPKVISSAVTTAMAQRLARKLCPSCKRETPLSGEDKKIVERVIAGIVDKGEVPEKRESHFTSAGCTLCHGSGYRGRIGIFEAILMDEEIEKLMKENPSEREIKRAARTQGILSMREDGMLKVLRGVTSLDELSRVIDVAGEEL